MDILTPVEPVVPSLVDMDGMVSALTTQVQLLDEEIECLKRKNNSLQHELTQVSGLTMNDVTVVRAPLKERVSQKYESQLQAHMDLVHRRRKQHDLMFHGFRQKICGVADDLSNQLLIVGSARDEEKKTVASLSSQMCKLRERVDSVFGDRRNRLENLEMAGARIKTTIAFLLPLVAFFHSLQQEVTRLRKVSHHCTGGDLSCSCRLSISPVQGEVSEVDLDIT